MKIKPVKDRVVVKPLGSEEKTAGGIIIPASAQDTEKRGKVESVGKDVEEVRVGDVVLFGQYGGTEVSIDGQDYRIIPESQIYAVL